MADSIRTKFPPAHAEDDVNLRPAGEVPWYLENNAENKTAAPASPSTASTARPVAHGEDDVNLRPAGEMPWYAGSAESGDAYSAAPAPSAPPAPAQTAWYQRVCAWFGD